MKYEAFFSRLGFGKLESDIYVTLLQNSPLSISDIAREIGTYRGVLYRIIPLLLEKWVISIEKEGKRTRYRAESPEKLRALYEAEQATFETIISQMERDYTRSVARSQFCDILKEETNSKKYLLMSVKHFPKMASWYRYSSRKADRSPDAELVQRYKELRNEKKLQRMIITNDELARTKRWWLG
jgi:predicted transcriptional regulator